MCIEARTPAGTVTDTETATDTATATPATGECSPNSLAELETTRLFTRESTIETGQPGVIAGGFLPSVGLQCDIIVRMTMQVPNNMCSRDGRAQLRRCRDRLQ